MMLEERRAEIIAAINAAEPYAPEGSGREAGEVRQRSVYVPHNGSMWPDAEAFTQAALMLGSERVADNGLSLRAAALADMPGADETIVIEDRRGMAFRISHVPQYMRGVICISSGWVTGNQRNDQQKAVA